MAHPQHEQARQRYDFRCGYCGVSEVDAGGELTVDHYCPVSAGGEDSEANLVYACIRCNLHKGAYWPDAEALTQGFRVLHPLQDDASEHWRENAEGVLEPITVTGRFHIELLELNRMPLVVHRQRKRANLVQVSQQRLMFAMMAVQAEIIQGLRQHLAELKSWGDWGKE